MSRRVSRMGSAAAVGFQVNSLVSRIFGTVIGVGMAAFGVVALNFTPDAPDPALADRAFWYGITLIAAGTLAVALTWLAPDLTNIWCRPPKRSLRD